MKNNLYKVRNIEYQLRQLNVFEIRHIIQNIEPLLIRKRVANTLERKPENLICPECKSPLKQKWGIESDMQRYRCKRCKHTYNSLSNTPLAHLHKKGRWWDYAICMTMGLTLKKAAVYCKISITTAFRWRHRFLEFADVIQPIILAGIVECDYLSFEYSFKGQPTRKATTPDHPDNVYVITGRDRHKNTANSVQEKLTSEEIAASLDHLLADDALFCSDNETFYQDFTTDYNYRHGEINRSEQIYENKEIVHLYQVMRFLDGMNSWISRFRGVSTYYLHKYVGWYRQLDEHNQNWTPLNVLQRAHKGGFYHVQRQELKVPKSLSISTP